MFDNRSDLQRDINKYKEYANVYHSIYWFRESEQKYSATTGNKTRIGPDYSTAVIDRIVLDIDAYQKTKRRNGQEFETYTNRAIEDMRTLEEWANTHNLMRWYYFSGGGFYFCFSAKGHPLKLRDFELNLQNKLNIHIDVSVVGDTARMMRVPNSFNFKEHRKRYCIPLKKEELYKPFEVLKERAKYPRFGERYIYGEEIKDFSECKLDTSKIKLKKLRVNLSNVKEEDADEILGKYGWSLDDICKTIKGILSKGHVGNSLRIELIKYFKSIIGLELNDCVKLLALLLGREGYHSAVEGQAKYAYAGGYRFTPDKLKGLGYCPLDCEECMKTYKIKYRLQQKFPKFSNTSWEDELDGFI